MPSTEIVDSEIVTTAVGGATRDEPFGVPRWAACAGRWSWILIGAAIVLVGLLALASATRVLVVSALFAVLLGGTFLPVVDWLARRHIPRWLGAILVALFLVACAVGIALIITYSVVNQVSEIQQRLDSAVVEIKKALNATSVPQSTADSVKAGVENLFKERGGRRGGEARGPPSTASPAFCSACSSASTSLCG